MTAAERLNDQPVKLNIAPQEDAPPTITLIPWTGIRRSELNPRRALDDKQLFELAIDIYHKGVLQNLVARPHPTESGAYELAAGERRWRAVGLLIEGLELVDEDGGEGRVLKVGADYALPVRVQPMTDLELLEVATTENLQREDMTPLDEADAFSRLVGLGMQPDEIAARFGYAVRTVEQRLVLASGLGREGRKLLRDGTINLAQAQVIAQTGGEFRRHLTKLVKEQPRFCTAEQLRRFTVERRLLVSNALFDVAASGLAVVEDLWGLTPAYFKDGERATTLQLAAIEARAAQDRASGAWAFVDVLACGAHANVRALPWDRYRSFGPEALRGVVYIHDEAGELWRHEGAVREGEARAASRAETLARRAEAREGNSPAVRDAAHRVGQEARARALWSRLVTDPHRCLALTVQGLLEPAGEVTLRAAPAPELAGGAPPEVQGAVERWTARRPDLFASRAPGTLNALKRGGELHDALAEMPPSDLLELLALCTHHQLHHWTHVTDRPGALAVHVAGAIGADEALAQQWALSADFLNAHTAAQLGDLIAELPAPLRPATRPSDSKKETVSRLLERRAALQRAGWVPKLVRFTR